MHVKTRSLIAGTLVLFSIHCAALAADAAAGGLKQGDRIVFLGDSITHGGLGTNGYISVMKRSIQAAHADLGVELIGAGVSGNKVPNLQQRLQRDVLDKKPTIVFIYIGINDVWHWRKDKDGKLAGGTPKDLYESGLKEIIGKIRSAGARAILCTPSVIGEKPDGTNANDAMLEEYAGISRKVAAEAGIELVDLRKAFIEYLKVHNTKNAERGILTGDRVHLNPEGNRLVAECMLKRLNVELAATPAATGK